MIPGARAFAGTVVDGGDWQSCFPVSELADVGSNRRDAPYTASLTSLDRFSTASAFSTYCSLPGAE
jgi:hypothetical protein